MIKILIVDDHELVRSGLRLLLELKSEFKVVAEASSGEEAVRICRKEAPDIVLMDVHMPGIGGLEATKQIARLPESPRVICISMHTQNPIPSKVMQMGAFGFITKSAEPERDVTLYPKGICWSKVCCTRNCPTSRNR